MSADKGTYKILCISLYKEDLRGVDALVERLKARGVSGRLANRSSLIRHALSRLDEGKLVKELGSK